MKYRKNPLFIALAMCSWGVPQLAMAEAESAKKPADDTLETVTVIGRDSQVDDTQGYDDIYDKNISGDYKGIKEIGAFQVNAAGDVLKGLNNVYNMSTRTAGSAISPNIRGISGKGRIAVTIDGTEQTIDTWLQNYGVGERNYLDPSLFRSITVEKGPALTRGVKSGVGGAVAIKTIEASDIVPEGKTWGIKFKGDFSNNAIKPKQELGDYLGYSDYRLIPGGATADGAGGGLNENLELSPYALIIDDFPLPESDPNVLKFGDDNAYRVAAAFDNDIADGLAAYSYRYKGDYFAGEKGADGYTGNKIYRLQDCEDNLYDDPYACGDVDSFIPNIADIYRPGEQVLNSSVESKTLLLKNNWKLPDNQKVGGQYMNTNIVFGEIPPAQMSWQLRGSDLQPYNKTKRQKDKPPTKCRR
ncbi:MAG: hypothetical protein CR957_00570 [Gammaproteobacteria bacterium]|nr:MAG: hypothetical protein CR957_00570 [Gammaproteobacteria bacterium]